MILNNRYRKYLRNFLFCIAGFATSTGIVLLRALLKGIVFLFFLLHFSQSRIAVPPAAAADKPVWIITMIFIGVILWDIISKVIDAVVPSIPTPKSTERVNHDIENELIKDVMLYFAFLADCDCEVFTKVDIRELMRKLAERLPQYFVFDKHLLKMSIAHFLKSSSYQKQCERIHLTESVDMPPPHVMVFSSNSNEPPLASDAATNKGQFIEKYREMFSEMSIQEIGNKIMDDLANIYFRYNLSTRDIEDSADILVKFLSGVKQKAIL